MKKILLLSVVCLLAATCLLACDKEQAPDTGTSAMPSTDTTRQDIVDSTEYLNVATDKVSDFKIIISKELSKNDYSYSLTFDLQKKIKALTGANLSVIDDWVKDGADTTADFEIVIGDCNRQVVKDN